MINYSFLTLQPYFCGHDPRCQELNSDWALNTAISNVEKHFPTGILILPTTLNKCEQLNL